MLDAFLVLSSCRQFGYGVFQPITLSEINSYVKMFNNYIELDLFIGYIKHLDSIFLKRVNKKG